jgi:hypothetical protein
MAGSGITSRGAKVRRRGVPWSALPIRIFTDCGRHRIAQACEIDELEL